MKDYIRLKILIVLLGACMISYAQPANKAKADSAVTKSRLAEGVKLGEVEVTGERKFGIESAQMSAIEMSAQQIKQVPMVFGTPDVLKALQKLPGVNSEGEGSVGISVRGGNIDQNLITLDGAMLYNPEHLKGYASAINPDVVGSVDFYRGAFPARYGSRLSSVVDVTMKEGDFKKYHGMLFVGALSGSVMVEGPIWKDRTSIVLGGRMSYFDILAYPVLKKVYDNGESLRPYSNMKYYDVNAKIVHKFAERNRLSASFYYGKDKDITIPTDEVRVKEIELNPAPRPAGTSSHIETQKSIREDSTATKWSNVCGALNWDREVNSRVKVGANATYSKYDYSIVQQNHYYSSREDEWYTIPIEERDPMTATEYLHKEDGNQDYFSKVEDVSAGVKVEWLAHEKHNIRMGAEVRMQELTPKVRVKNSFFYKGMKSAENGGLMLYKKTSEVDTLMGGEHELKQYSVYVEDDYEPNRNIRLNAGVRVSLHAVEGKTYASVEPRLSVRWKFMEDNALKASYSRMAQSTHRLATNNLISTSELWVPITKDIPLMKSDMVAVGYVRDIIPGVSATVEGYYKTMNDMIEYKQNANYALALRDWSKMVSVGDGRSYGVELMLEKTTGRTTGWVSYTWSKSLRRFDRAGDQVNGGKEFYANNDRRNNVNIMVSHKIPVSKKSYWELNASWSYQTGRRGTVPVTQALGAKFAYFEGYARVDMFSSVSSMYTFDGWSYDKIKDYEHVIDELKMAMSFKQINDYTLPSIHHLDLSANFNVKHGKGESVIGLSVYNVYNRMNANTAYIGYNDDDKIVLKLQCPFPIMPSVSYTYKF